MKQLNSPPSVADRFLRFFLKDELAEEVIGDLFEQFQYDYQRQGLLRARLQYWFQVFNYCRPFAVKRVGGRLKLNDAMWKHNFKIGWRSLTRSKYLSLIHIGGLSLGMTIVILTSLWIWDELKYDKFHENYDHIYQVIAHRDFNGNIFTDRNMVFPLANTMSDNVGQIEDVTWTTHQQSNLFSKGEKSMQLSGHDVGGSFFDIFSWKFIHGNAESAFLQPGNVVLTESAAIRIFGKTDVIGEGLTLNNSTDLVVSAILEDVPEQSTMNFDYVRPFNFSDPNIQSLQ